jgi:hypothetical protein
MSLSGQKATISLTMMASSEHEDAFSFAEGALWGRSAVAFPFPASCYLIIRHNAVADGLGGVRWLNRE